MFHKTRSWCVVEVRGEALDAQIGNLAELLTDHSWCSCAGWRLRAGDRSHLFLNDQTSADGAFEVGVVLETDDLAQVESITFGWCDREKATHYIRQVVAGAYDGTPRRSGIQRRQIQTPEEHRVCCHCA